MTVRHDKCETELLVGKGGIVNHSTTYSTLVRYLYHQSRGIHASPSSSLRYGTKYSTTGVGTYHTLSDKLFSARCVIGQPDPGCPLTAQ